MNYLIDSTFTNVNRLFILTFQRIAGENNTTKDTDFFSDYYLHNVEIKDFNVLINEKSFFDLPVETEEESYEKIIEMSNNNYYATGNLLDFGYFKENYKLIVIDLSKQTKLKDLQQISFVGKLKNQDHEATIIFIIEKHLLNGSNNENSKFATKKWYIIYHESKVTYSHKNPIKFLTSSLESSLSDYSDACILVTGGDANAKVSFKNSLPFTKCMTEINETFIDDAKHYNVYV